MTHYLVDLYKKVVQNQTVVRYERLQLNTIMHLDKVHNALIFGDSLMLHFELH